MTLAPSPASFLALPIECRLKIYVYVFANETVEVTSKTIWPTEPNHNILEWRAPPIKRFPSHDPDFPITLVNRMIRAECLPLLRKALTIVHHHRVATSIEYTVPIRREWAAQLRTLNVVFYQNCFHYLPQVHNLPQLKMLWVEFSDETWWKPIWINYEGRHKIKGWIDRGEGKLAEHVREQVFEVATKEVELHQLATVYEDCLHLFQDRERKYEIGWTGKVCVQMGFQDRASETLTFHWDRKMIVEGAHRLLDLYKSVLEQYEDDPQPTEEPAIWSD